MSERLKIADLKFDPQNARVRTAKGEAMIQESLRSVGAARSIVIDEDGTILAGNGTVEAAGQIGIDNVVIVEASGDEIIAVRRKGLTDEQKKKLAYYDNRTGDEAEWDMEQVARDLLGGYEFLDELFDNIEVPAPETEGTDELPEDPAEVLREKWGVEYGDLWQIGNHRILCGDSTNKEDVDRLLDGAIPDVLWSDPPYGLGGYAGRSGKHRKVGGDDADKQTLISFYRAGDAAEKYVWCEFRTYPILVEALGVPRSLIVWGKNSFGMGSGYRRQHEFLAYWGGFKGTTESDLWIESRDTDYLHPTQKPASLCQRALNNSGGDTVLCPFAGSGDALIAAHNEARTCYAMEIDPAYVAVCIERMAQLGYDPDKVEKSEG